VNRRRILFLADSSSQLKPAYTLADYFRRKAGWEIVGNIVPGASTPSRRQVVDAGVRCPLTAHSVAKLGDIGAFFEFDAVICFLPGSRLHSFLHHFDRAIAKMNPPRRPATITGYNGVVYEGHLEGLLWRTGYDFVCLNSRADHRRFTAELESLGYEGTELIPTGFTLAQRDGLSRLRPFEEMQSQDILFATQAIVPSAPREREYILKKLRIYAEAYPSRKVYIKPRSLPNERTFHVEKHHYAILYDKLFGRTKPKNLLFGYGSLSRYLDRIGLLVTVSSTAVIEGMAHGVPGAILGDFGIKESLGNHFFRDSGMLTTLDKLINGDVPQVDPDWMADNGFAPEDSLDALHTAVSEFLQRQEQAGERLVTLSPYYDADRAPYLHERTLPIDDPKPPPVRTRLESAYYKGRKLVRSPRKFFEDSPLKRKKKRR